jgi:putative phosphonate metabolism protein
MSYTRFAIYYVPPDGAMADFGAAWLGWDIAGGEAAAQPNIAGLGDVTMTPRKYGFHGTLKPPFRLAEGQSLSSLKDAVATLAAGHAPAVSGPLKLSGLGRFLALIPSRPTDDLAKLAAACVMDLDRFRAPMSDAELARRRAADLAPHQEAHLIQWGYPYVLDAFRFHLTLTGELSPKELSHWETVLTTHLPPLADLFVVRELALVGERTDGLFEMIHRYALTG